MDELRNIVQIVTEQGIDNSLSEEYTSCSETTVYVDCCEHYSRKCKVVSPCCNKEYSCRLCHDNDVDKLCKHKFDRKSVKEVVCNSCKTRQTISNVCVNCKTVFGTYFCDICNLYDNIDKGQYHCKDCDMCRVGGEKNFFHCKNCNLCISSTVKDTHKCIDVTDTNCPICMEDIFSSVTECTNMKCGHYIHTECLKLMISHGGVKCPTCLVTIINTTEYNKFMDNEVAMTVIPEEYKDIDVSIMCNDCHNKSTVKFHIVGYKCESCSSYNTRKI